MSVGGRENGMGSADEEVLVNIFSSQQLGLQSYFHSAKSAFFSLSIFGAKQSLLWWFCTTFAGIPSASKQRVQLCGICFLEFSVDLVDLFRHWPFLFCSVTVLLMLTLQFFSCFFFNKLLFSAFANRNDAVCRTENVPNVKALWPGLDCCFLISSDSHLFAFSDSFISMYLQNHTHQWMSGRGAPFTDKNSGHCITSSIILGPLFSILSHTGATSQCEGGILFDRPVQMLNDSDTKRGPTTQVLTGLFSIKKRLDLT